MLRRLGLVFATLALFAIVGGHWAVLQTVAWAGMLHDYAQQSGSFAVAAEQTFDGQHPCELCRQIQVAKLKERKQNPATSDLKADAKVKATVTPSLLPAFVRTVGEIVFARAATPDGPSRTEPPPTPPPRLGHFAA